VKAGQIVKRARTRSHDKSNRQIKLHTDCRSAELLSRLLRFRDQVCADLGLRPIADTSLETYIRRTRESLVEIREAMTKKSLAVGLGQYYSDKLGLGRQRSRRVWLGDYPRIAEERRAAGLGPGLGGAAVFE
jgi:hypothetical protein